MARRQKRKRQDLSQLASSDLPPDCPVRNQPKENEKKTSALDPKQKGREEADLRQQEDWSEAVEDLLEEAVRGAAEFQGSVEGAATSNSHTFHHNLKLCLSQFGLESYKDLCVGDLGEFLCQVMKICEDPSCRPQPTTGRSLFPLPVNYGVEAPSDSPPFLRTIAVALNSLHGVTEDPQRSSNKTSNWVMKRLQRIVEGSAILREPLPKIDLKELFSQRSVDYAGEEVKVAKSIVWKSVSLSFPEQVGSLQLLDFVEGGVRHFVEHIDNYLLHPDDQLVGKTPRVFVEPSEWPVVAKGLVEKGICTIIKESDIYTVGGSPVLNGMFTVSKEEYKDDVLVTRLIMNLKPFNRISRSMEADTGTLPSVTSLGSIHLDPDQELCICSEDIRCFFYLFEVPQCWWKFTAFGLKLPPEMVPPEYGKEACYITSKVLPMGYLNSVGVAQHVHRRVVRLSMTSVQPSIGGERELRRDRPFSQAPNLFRVYLDNYDQVFKVDKKLASLLEGSVTKEVEALREHYASQGLPRHPKKAVQSQFQGEIQGAWVDGRKGEVFAKPGKLGKYVSVVLEVLLNGAASQRELQIIGGGLVYVAMFKRPLLCGLNQLWTDIVDMEGLPPSLRRPLRKEVVHELVRFLGLAPLAFMNLRLPYDPIVTCSDASTSGGGACLSRGLTPYGAAAALCNVRGDIPEAHDFQQILSVGLFDGISALRVALDILELPIAGHISVESNSEARRVVEAWFPDTLFVTDIHEVDEEQVKSWALRYTLVSLILVGAGPPCQGVSGLNYDRKGALRDGRSVLYQQVPRVVGLLRVAFPWAQVHYLGENVASMDYQDCFHMNEGYGVLPWYIDASGISPCHRPRLYWCSWELFETEGTTMIWGSDGRLPIEGEITLTASFDPHDFTVPGWKIPQGKLPTFTTSRPSPHPLRRPAGLKTCREHELKRWQEDCHRFPPYQYKDENCLTNNKGEFRPPTIEEREAMLGFPIGFTKQCMSKSFHDSTQHHDCRLSLLGNSWSVGVVAWLIMCLMSLRGFIDVVPTQEIITRLTPGKNTNLHSLLLRPPFARSTKTLDVSEMLVRKLCGLVSLKGEDLLVQSYSDTPVRYHRLRSSLPSSLWRWRTISGWRWVGNPEHINALELRSVLTTIKWRVEQRRQTDIRCVHMVDSLVVLHALTRGRSSSRKLRRSMMRLNSYLLATGLQPLWAYVDTKTNPADRPSRFFVKKKWVKRA